MFLGSHEHSLDEKNRVVLPQGLRKYLSEGKLEEGFVLVAGTKNRFLELHPMEEWIRREKKLAESLVQGDESSEEALLDLHATVVNVELDKQYRFVIPDASRALVGIGRDVVFIGVYNKIVIYAKDRWEARSKERQGASAEGGSAGDDARPAVGESGPR
jgi:MraZ protein